MSNDPTSDAKPPKAEPSAGKPTTWIELLKYPILVFSIVLGLLAVKSWSILDLSRVTKISASGIEFESAISKALTQIEVRLASLETSLPKSTAQPTASMAAETAAASQTVSDSTARVSALATESGGAPIQGYIWLGNYDGKWHPARLGLLDTGQPVDLAPDKMEVGTRYRALLNIIVKEELPTGDDWHSRGRHSMGVVPSGKTIAIVAPPVRVERSFGLQYWAKVQYGE